MSHGVEGSGRPLKRSRASRRREESAASDRRSTGAIHTTTRQRTAPVRASPTLQGRRRIAPAVPTQEPTHCSGGEHEPPCSSWGCHPRPHEGNGEWYGAARGDEAEAGGEAGGDDDDDNEEEPGEDAFHRMRALAEQTMLIVARAAAVAAAAASAATRSQGSAAATVTDPAAAVSAGRESSTDATAAAAATLLHPAASGRFPAGGGGGGGGGGEAGMLPLHLPPPLGPAALNGAASATKEAARPAAAGAAGMGAAAAAPRAKAGVWPGSAQQPGALRPPSSPASPARTHGANRRLPGRPGRLRSGGCCALRGCTVLRVRNS